MLIKPGDSVSASGDKGGIKQLEGAWMAPSSSVNIWGRLPDGGRQ